MDIRTILELEEVRTEVETFLNAVDKAIVKGADFYEGIQKSEDLSVSDKESFASLEYGPLGTDENIECLINPLLHKFGFLLSSGGFPDEYVKAEQEMHTHLQGIFDKLASVYGI